ncbi:MAG TPA: hypothetical protein VF110_09815 [Burkholderiales bacterium]
MSPRAERALVIASWCFCGVLVVVAAYGQFAVWAVNAPPLGKTDMGLALFFAISGAWAMVTLFWITPVAAILALVAWLARKGSPLALLIAALASGVPLLLMG